MSEPREWREATLLEVADLGFGATPSRSVDQFWDKSGNGYPWASIADLRRSPVVDTTERITSAGIRSSSVHLVRAGTPVMSFKLTVGRVAIAGTDLYTNEAIVAVKGKPGVVDDRWLFHVLPVVASTGVLDSAVKGNTLNKRKLEQLRLTLPPLGEQRRIAEVLDTLDKVIKSTERLIAKLEQAKQGLLHDLLTRGIAASGNLRADSVVDFVDSPLGRIPRSWRVVALGEMVESAIDGPFGSNLKSEHYVKSSGVRVVRLQNIGRGFFDDSDRAYVSAQHAERMARHGVNPGDLLVASLGDENHPYARACVYPDSLEAGIVKADCFRLRMKRGLSENRYVMHVLNCSTTRSGLSKLAQGVTRDRVNLASLQRFLLRCPPVEEQRAIVEWVQSVSSRCASERSNLEKLRLLKQGLMDDLLTGRVRAHAAEEVAAG